jgi:hypothetical protein
MHPLPSFFAEGTVNLRFLISHGPVFLQHDNKTFVITDNESNESASPSKQGFDFILSHIIRPFFNGSMINARVFTPDRCILFSFRDSNNQLNKERRTPWTCANLVNKVVEVIGCRKFIEHITSKMSLRKTT